MQLLSWLRRQTVRQRGNRPGGNRLPKASCRPRLELLESRDVPSTVSFSAPVSYPIGTSGANYGVTVGDFNGDGKPDLAVSNSGDNFISLLLGNGDGTFQPAQNSTV